MEYLLARAYKGLADACECKLDHEFLDTESVADYEKSYDEFRDAWNGLTLIVKGMSFIKTSEEFNEHGHDLLDQLKDEVTPKMTAFMKCWIRTFYAFVEDKLED